MTTDQSPPVSRAFMSRLREVLTARLPAGPGWVVWVDGVVEELADVTPAQGNDRDALVMLIDGWGAEQPLHLADAVLALVRPVEGVTLTPEERDLNRRIVTRMAGFARAGSVLEFDPEAVGKLADRLEALS